MGILHRMGDPCVSPWHTRMLLRSDYTRAVIQGTQSDPDYLAFLLEMFHLFKGGNRDAQKVARPFYAHMSDDIMKRSFTDLKKFGAQLTREMEMSNIFPKV